MKGNCHAIPTTAEEKGRTEATEAIQAAGQATPTAQEFRALALKDITMKLTLTNNQTHPVPIMSAQGDGFADELQPSQAYTFDRSETVLVIGNKPSVTEQIQTGVAVIAETVKRLIAAWQGHNNAATQSEAAAVNVTIINNGEKEVRVVLGDGTTDVTVAGQGERYEATAWGYVELRELGDVAVDPNQHEAA